MLAATVVAHAASSPARQEQPTLQRPDAPAKALSGYPSAATPTYVSPAHAAAKAAQAAVTAGLGEEAAIAAAQAAGDTAAGAAVAGSAAAATALQATTQVGPAPELDADYGTDILASLDASPVPDAVLFAPEPPPRTPPGSPPPPLPPFPPSPPSVPLIGFVAPWNAESEVGCCDGDGLDLLRSYFVRRSPGQLPTTCVWITARHAMSPLSTCGAPAQNLMGAGEATCRGDCTVDEACLAYEYSEPTEWAEAGGGTTDGYGQKCALFKSAPSGVASSDIVCRCWVKTISK